MADIDQVQDSELPIGERLREAREAKGLSLDEIAGRTRIPVRHLQHIESGDWDALPAITYSVGFVRSYANDLGLDGTALGAELRDQLGGARRPGIMSEQYYEPADPARVPPRWLAIAAAVIAVLLIAGYLIFRSGIDDGRENAQPAPSAQTAQAQPKAQPQPAAAPQDPTGQPVVLTAAEEVWLRVYEAGGQKLFEGTLRQGEQYRVPAGAQRPQLMTGRPNVLRVTVGNSAIPQLGPAERRIRDVSLAPADLVAFAQRGGAAPPAAEPRP
jgi:cytoskeletal protein RodZ